MPVLQRSAKGAGGFRTFYGWLTHERPWPLAVVSAGVFTFALVIAVAWPLGFVLSLTGVSASERIGSISFRSVPAITAPEQQYLDRTLAKVFGQGLPGRDLRPWAEIPDRDFFGVKAKSRAPLRAVVTEIRRLAPVFAAGQTVDAATTTAAHANLDAVERIEGKNRAVVLYHRGLLYLLANDTGNARKALDEAAKKTRADLAAIEKRRSKVEEPPAGQPAPPDIAATRAAGVLAATEYALGEVAALESKWPEARQHFQSAQAEALGGRAWNEASSDTQLFTLRPSDTLFDYDSATFLNDALVAAKRAGAAGPSVAILTALEKEPQKNWQLAQAPGAAARERLAAEAWIAAAYWGEGRLAHNVAPDWTAPESGQWRTALAIARYIATDADAADMPSDALMPWRDYIGHTRIALQGDLDEAAFRSAMTIPPTVPNQDLLRAWRDATLTAIGGDLLDRGLAGDRRQARAFVLSNRDIFPGPLVRRAAAEASLGGLSQRAGWLISLAIMLIAVGVIWRLWGVRASCRLTFPTHHFDDRAAWETPFQHRQKTRPA